MRIETVRKQTWTIGLLVACVCALVAACGGGRDDLGIPSASVSGFALLAGTEAMRPEGASARFEPPQPIPGVELSPELGREIQASGAEITVRLRLMISAEGRISGATARELVPEDSPLAERLAEEVSTALWGWRYRPATQGGMPVRAFVDLTFEVRGGTAD